MLNVYINRNPIIGPYGGGNHWVTAFHEYAQKNNLNLVKLNKNKTFDIKPDIMLMMSPHIENPISDLSIQEMFNIRNELLLNRKHSIIIGRVNECDARKATTGVDELWTNVSKILDGTIWVSNWLKSYFWQKTGWFCRDDQVLRNAVIINGVNKKIFKRNTQNQINNGKINIVMAHWSDNPLKGADYIKFLDEFVGNNNQYTFTFIGRTKVELKNSRHIPPLFGEELGKAIARNSICINASRFDPGPNSTIEAISCGLPTYVHSDGGGSVEFAGSDHVFSSFDDLTKILLNKYHYNQTSFLSWELVMKQVFDFLKETYYVTKNE